MFKPSELILNADGSVYHLALHPEEVAPTIITVGDPERVAKVTAHFDRVDTVRQKREFLTHTGEIAGQRVSVIATGIGTDNIDIVLNELDALLNIDLATRQLRSSFRALRIVRFGTSGSLQADLAPGDFLVSAFAAGLDNLLSFYQPVFSEGEKNMGAALARHLQVPTPPYVVAGSENLLALFADWPQGVTATCPGFYGPQGRSLRAPAAMPDLPERLGTFRFGGLRITNFEMETSAIYGLSRILGHEALSLNVIMANRIHGTFAEDPAKAEARLIRDGLERLLG